MSSVNREPVLFTLIVIAVVGIVLALVRFAAPLLNPILLAIFIAALAYPPFRWLNRKLGRRPLALLGTVGLITVGAFGFVLFLLFSASTLRDDLGQYSAQLTQRVAELATRLAAGSAPTNAGRTISAVLDGALAGIVGASLGALGDLLFSIVLAALLLLQARQFAQFMNTDLRDKPVIGQVPDVMRTIIKYFGIRTRLNLMTGAGMTLFLFLLGVDSPLLWGVLVFILSYVPYIGLFVAMTPPVLLALAEFGWERAGLVILAAAIVNLTIENVVEPGYTARRLRLSAAVVFVAFFVCVWLLGPVGAALAMPITVLVALVCARYPGTRWIAMLLTGGKDLLPEETAGATQAAEGDAAAA